MAGKLSAVAVKASKAGVNADGQPKARLIGDGGGLFLQVSPTGKKSWIYRYKVAGKHRLMGLGAVDVVTLAEARDHALQCRRAVHRGGDPIEQRRAVRAAAMPPRAVTFEAVARAYVAAHSAGWRNAKHRDQWHNTLATYALPIIGTTPVADVNTDAVRAVLEPIWNDKPETAARVRGRIESILDYATSSGLRAGDNPARWRGHLANLLPPRGRLERVAHHPALPWRDMAGFMSELVEQGGIAALALQFTILTAARTGEVTGATWPEIDLQAAVWTVPAGRMKAGQEHRVPLTTAAVTILRAVQPLRSRGDFVFPGARVGSGLSGASMAAVLKRMGRTDITVHGFRSTFRDWAGESTAYPRDVAEAALAHTVRDRVEAAYRRGDLLEKRRAMFADWAAWCAGGPEDLPQCA